MKSGDDFNDIGVVKEGVWELEVQSRIKIQENTTKEPCTQSCLLFWHTPMHGTHMGILGIHVRHATFTNNAFYMYQKDCSYQCETSEVITYKELSTGMTKLRVKMTYVTVIETLVCRISYTIYKYIEMWVVVDHVVVFYFQTNIK